MRSDNLKLHDGFRIQLKFSVNAARKVSLSGKNAHRSEKAYIILFSDVAFEANDTEIGILI